MLRAVHRAGIVEVMKTKRPPSPLKQRRLSERWKLREAAERAGVDPATVHRWESGMHMPSPEGLYALARLYRCSVEDLGFRIVRVEAVERLPAPSGEDEARCA